MNVPLYFSQTVTNGVKIDWGDGSDTQTLSGTGNVNTSHTYTEIGDYIINLEVINGTLGLGHNTYTYCVMGPTSNNGRVYCNMLQKVEIGNSVTRISGQSFYQCHSLVNITIPNSVTSMENQPFSSCHSLTSIIFPDSIGHLKGYEFRQCYSLKSVIVPNSVTSIGSSMCYNCFSLASVTIPNSVATIKSKTFYDCYGMAFYDFTSHTSVPTLANTDAFSGIPSDCEIRVPAALYDEWIVATNWSTYADYIVAV